MLENHHASNGNNSMLEGRLVSAVLYMVVSVTELGQSVHLTQQKRVQGSNISYFI